MRIGAKQRPFYRVVAVDERAKRTGGYLELLGTYNPLTEPHEIKLKQDRIDYWLKQGAQPSDGFLRITGKAPQRPPRKPKKSKQGTVDSEQGKPQQAAQAETKPEEEKSTVHSQQSTANSEQKVDEKPQAAEPQKEEPTVITPPQPEQKAEEIQPEQEKMEEKSAS